MKKENIKKPIKEIKQPKVKNEPFFQRLVKEVKRIRWIKKEEGVPYFKSILIWGTILALFFLVIDLIIKAILHIK